MLPLLAADVEPAAVAAAPRKAAAITASLRVRRATWERAGAEKASDSSRDLAGPTTSCPPPTCSALPAPARAAIILHTSATGSAPVREARHLALTSALPARIRNG